MRMEARSEDGENMTTKREVNAGRGLERRREQQWLELVGLRGAGRNLAYVI